MILNLSNNIKFIPAAIVLTLITVIFSQSLPILFFIVVILILTHVLSKETLLLLLLAALLIISSDLNENYRLILNVVSISTFLFFFIKKYGINIKNYPKIPEAIFYFVILVLFSMVLSSLFSKNFQTGLIETARQLIFFILIYAAYSFISGQKETFKLVNMLLITGTILSIIIIYSFLTSDLASYLLQSQGLIHEGGSFKNVAAAGGILTVSISLNLGLWLYEKRKNFKYLFALLFLVQLLALVLTNSRAAIAAALLSSLIILYILKRKIFYRVIFYLVSLAVISIIFFPSLLEVISLYSRLDRVMENTRYFLWDMSFDIIESHPVFGTGPGQFKQYMYGNLPVMIGSWEEAQISWIHKEAGMGESHNFFLFKTAELGILGLITALILPVLFFYITREVIKAYKNNTKTYYIIISIFALGIGLFIRSFFESTGFLSYGWITRDLPFWLCFSIVVYFYQKRDQLTITK